MKRPFKNGYKITQVFANNPDYYGQWGFKAHEGLDLIPLDSDWTIYSMEDGVVVQDVDSPRDNYGKYCVIWNKENKRAFWYCHMDSNVISIGQSVKAGDKLGKMGSTGNSSGAHLHLGLRKSDSNGSAVNLNNGFKGFIDPLPLLGELNKENTIQDILKTDIPTEVEDMFGFKKIKRYTEKLTKNCTWGDLLYDWVEMTEELTELNSKMDQEASVHKELVDLLEANILGLEKKVEGLEGTLKTEAQKYSDLMIRYDRLFEKLAIEETLCQARDKEITTLKDLLEKTPSDAELKERCVDLEKRCVDLQAKSFDDWLKNQNLKTKLTFILDILRGVI